VAGDVSQVSGGSHETVNAHDHQYVTDADEVEFGR
jgi:hypothetical protein